MIKRVLDLIISSMVIVLLLPVLLIVVLISKYVAKLPVIFKQERPGLHGKPFFIYKLCSMRDVRGANGQLLEDKDRVTRYGLFLRKTSLDEIPQLWNVLKGDLSLVGPRPLLMEYLPLYNEVQMRRHDVKPGITGWAQVNGRNAISWEAKFDYDVWYVDHQSFGLDMRILWLTLLRVVKTKDTQQAGHVTMAKFKGSP